MLWDVFCKVIDNHGDLGISWRLCVDLAQRGEHVRLWVDAPADLDWMAPAGHPNVEVVHWSADSISPLPGQVVIEAFGCDPPDDFVHKMNGAQPPVWINLEYLSAEDYVDRSHGLPSPVAYGPGRGLTKWFFFPGFTPTSGGLLREPGLLERVASWRREPWLLEHACLPQEHEAVVALFCYRHAPVDRLLKWVERFPTLLLVVAGQPREAVERELGIALPHAEPLTLGKSRIQALSLLSQEDFDHLLWSADLNFVRGEDSIVRAQWAGRPFVWQIYRQDDNAHEGKLEAYLKRMYTASLDCSDYKSPIGSDANGGNMYAAWRVWNGLPLATPPSADIFQEWRIWQPTCERWRMHLATQADLVHRLRTFVHRHIQAAP